MRGGWAPGTTITCIPLSLADPTDAPQRTEGVEPCEVRHEQLVRVVGPRTAGPHVLLGVGLLTYLITYILLFYNPRHMAWRVATRRRGLALGRRAPNTRSARHPTGTWYYLR